MAERIASPDPTVRGVTALGEAVRRQLDDAMAALRGADLTLADVVVRSDLAINRARYELEDEVAAELGRGPIAPARLRLLIAVLSAVNDLERMGDHCEGIAKVALMLGPAPARPIPPGVYDLGTMVAEMLERGLLAFASADADDARLTSAVDDAVDDLYDRVYAEVLAIMIDDRESVVSHTYLLWVAHNLERIADRVTNLCERTVYRVTGRLEESNVSNY